MPFLLSVNVPPYSEWQTRLASQHPQTRHTTLLTVIFLWQFRIISFWWTLAYCGGQFDHTMKEKTVPENLWNMCVAPHFCRTLRQWAELPLVWQRVNRPIHSNCKLQIMSGRLGGGGGGGGGGGVGEEKCLFCCCFLPDLASFTYGRWLAVMCFPRFLTARVELSIWIPLTIFCIMMTLGPTLLTT